MIDIELRTFLLSKPAISGALANRVYPLRLPQATQATALTYEINGLPDVLVGGRAKVERFELTLNVYSPSYATLRTLSTAVGNELTGFEGNMGAISVSGVYPITSFNTFEEEQNLYREILTFNLYTN